MIKNPRIWINFPPFNIYIKYCRIKISIDHQICWQSIDKKGMFYVDFKELNISVNGLHIGIMFFTYKVSNLTLLKLWKKIVITEKLLILQDYYIYFWLEKSWRQNIISGAIYLSLKRCVFTSAHILFILPDHQNNY